MVMKTSTNDPSGGLKMSSEEKWLSLLENCGIKIVDDWQVSQVTSWILTRSEARKLISELRKIIKQTTEDFL